MPISAQEAQQLLGGQIPTTGAASKDAGISPEEAQQLLTPGQPAPPHEELDRNDFLTLNHPQVRKTLDKLSKHPIINAGLGAGQNILESIANMGNLTANLGSRGVTALANAISKEKMKAPQAKVFEAPRLARPGISKTLGEVAGMGATFVAGGPVTEALGGAARALPMGAKALEAAKAIISKVPAIGKALPGVLERATGAGLVGGVIAPGDHLRAAARMAEFSPIADIASAMAAPAVKAAAAPILAGKKITQKLLRKFFTKQAYPFVTKHLNDVLTDLKGASSNVTSNEDLYNNILKHYEELQGDSEIRASKGQTNKYIAHGASVGDSYSAIPQHLPFHNPTLQGNIDSNIADVNKRLKPFAETELMGEPLKNTLKYLQDAKKIKIENLGEAKTSKENINDLIAGVKEGDPLRGYLRDIKDNGVFEGIRQGAKNAGPEAADMLKEADTRYKNEIVPFKETAKDQKSPFIKRYYGRKNIDGLTSEYIKPGAQKDQAGLVHNLMKITPPDGGASRRLAAYDYLKEGEDNPMAMLNKWSKLGTKQKSLLLPEYHDELDQLVNLSKKHPNAFKPPKEGGVGNYIKHGVEIMTSLGLATHGMAEMSPVPFLVPPLASAAAKKMFGTHAGQELFLKELTDRGLLDKANLMPHREALRNAMLALKELESKKRGNK